MTGAEWQSIRLLKTLFPLLPRTTSSSLRAVIRRTILTDIKTANQRTKNHKLNRAVQAMLFGMIERGMSGPVLGDKGKLRGNLNSGAVRSSDSGGEAMWAVVLTKELWKKGVWFVQVIFGNVTRVSKTKPNAGMMPNLSPLLRWDVFTLSPRSRARLCTSSLAVTMNPRTVTMRVKTM